MSDHQSLESIREEEIAEKRELYKGVFKPLKQWYSSTNAIIKNKYGDIPMFWQDLESWPHTKALVKLFLTIEEKKQSGQDVDDVKLEEKLNPSSSIDVISSKDATNNVEQDKSNDNSQSNGVAKKKRNRWGDAHDAQPITTDNSSAMNVSGLISNNDTDTNIYAQECVHSSSSSASLESLSINAENKKPKKSRWAPSSDSIPTLSAAEIAAKAQEIAQQTLILNMKMQHINERLVTVMMDAARIEQDPNRSPSPPPRYDSNGKRTNTREIRMREDLMKERVKVIEELISINPSYMPPPDYVRQKPFRKLYIPIKEFPTYNFIGLLIGPRGNTQRSMEQESGCKISIRGKGSAKNFGQTMRKLGIPDDDDDLHVHIQGDNEANVEKGSALVQKILTPIDDDSNEHKQKQLRELALINGTFQEEYCPICGEKGHRQYECTNRTQSFKPANVKCSICGDLSHPTRDCPFKEAPNREDNGLRIDQEYSSFMAELDSKSGKKSTTIAAPSIPVTMSSSYDTSYTASTVSTTSMQRLDEPSTTRGQTIIHAPIMPTSSVHVPPPNQQTIMMPAIVDPPASMYPPPGSTWNGMSYVQPVTYPPSMPSYYPSQPYGYPAAVPPYGATYPPTSAWPPATSQPPPPPPPR